MLIHCRRLSACILSAGAAAVFGALSVQAATLGHSRVSSLAHQPLRIVVQIKGLTQSELTSLSAQIAPAAAWQEAGLTPPVGLDSLNTHFIPGPTLDSMQLVVQSDQPAQSSVLDVLVDIKTNMSTQRHQVSVLQAQQNTPVHLAAAASAPRATPPTTQSGQSNSENSSATLAPATQQLQVRKGQNLYGIARQLRHALYSDQQMMAALVQANPEAFIQGNMNLLRAGATLTVPDVDTVAAISPQQARQLYQQHLQSFDEYRQRIAKGQSATPNTTPSTPEPSPIPVSPQVEDINAGADRLQLSAQTEKQAKADQATAVTQELAYTAQRLAQLQAADSTPEETATDALVPTEQTLSQTDSASSELNVLASAPDVSATNTQQLTDTSLPETQQTTDSATDSASSTEITSDPNSISPPAVNTTPDIPLVNEAATEHTASWFDEHLTRILLGALLLVVLLVTWILRRGHAGRMEYAESVPYHSSRVREKLDKINLDLNSPPTDEVEFREIK